MFQNFIAFPPTPPPFGNNFGLEGRRSSLKSIPPSHDIRGNGGLRFKCDFSGEWW